MRDGRGGDARAGNRVQYAGNVAAGRFSADVTQAVVHRSIEHGQFLARVEGAGFVADRRVDQPRVERSEGSTRNERAAR